MGVDGAVMMRAAFASLALVAQDGSTSATKRARVFVTKFVSVYTTKLPREKSIHGTMRPQSWEPRRTIVSACGAISFHGLFAL